MKREDMQEYLDCNGVEALTSSQGTRYYDEETVISIALEVVKNRSIPAVSNRRELLDAFQRDYNKRNFEDSQIIDQDIELFLAANCG